MRDYEELIGKHKGESCFVLGAGCSLWYNMHNPLFTYLKEYGIVITVNSAILAEPQPDYFISCDALCLRWSWFGLVRKSKCKKIVRSSWIEKHKKEIEDFYIFSPRKTSESEIDFEEKNLMYCNSLNAAIDLGIQLGVKRIFILGLDHCLDKKTGFHHFWQFLDKKPQQIRPAQSKWSVQQSVFPIHLQSYKALKKFAEHKGSKIYNVSYMDPEKDNRWITEVDVFEIISLNQVEKIVRAE